MSILISIILQHTATYCNILQHTATNCNTLQHTHCTTLQHTAIYATYCNTLQHTATHCASSAWSCDTCICDLLLVAAVRESVHDLCHYMWHTSVNIHTYTYRFTFKRIYIHTYMYIYSVWWKHIYNIIQSCHLKGSHSSHEWAMSHTCTHRQKFSIVSSLLNLPY